MKHIILDAREYSASGTGIYMSRLIKQLEILDSGHQYSVLLYPKDIEKWQPTNPNFTKVVCPHKEFTFDEQIGLKRQLDELRPDLVHFGMVQQPVWYKGKTVTTMNDLTTLRFRNPSKNPIVFTVKQWVYAWVNKHVAHKADHLLTYTDFVRQDIAAYAHVDLAKFTITYLAADAIAETPRPIPELGGKRFIMYIGRPLPHKNLRRLINSFATLKHKHPDLVLVLAGKKDTLYEQHEKYVQNQNIPDVLFTGRVSEGELRWLYEHCAVYVFPSLSEGFGLPGLEAMVHGAPVASSSATCLPEVYGDAAAYFNPLSIEEMAATIDKILTDETFRGELIGRGQGQVAKYSWRTTAERTLAVYKQVLGE